MTAIEQLARFVVSADGGTLGDGEIGRAKHAFLDTIGCMFLGADASSTKAAISLGRIWGEGTAPVYGTDVFLPAPIAAMANGASAHAYDLDDYTLQANDHASAVLVPAVLAAMERAPDRYSGRDLLEAYLTGLEVIFRLGEAVNMGHYNLGWHTTSTLDSFGATAAVCRLWGLEEGQVASALSLTTSLGSGYVSQFGTDAKPLHAGFSAKTGLIAAGLGEGGASAYRGALDGNVSFRTLLCPGGEAGFDTAFAKLGQPWAVREFGLGAKVYPSCGYTHRSIDCAVELHRKLGIRSADEIESARACLPDFHLAILPFGVPQDRTEALFSTAYCVAVGLVTGDNRIEDFFDEAVTKPEMQALAGRIEVTRRAPKRPEINLDGDDPDTVEVVLKDGRRETAAVGIWTGAPGRDLDAAGFEKKFKSCMSLAGGRVRNDQAARLQDTLTDLDRANSISALRDALTR